jgi:DNA-binding Lrp family transcriptional regulator
MVLSFVLVNCAIDQASFVERKAKEIQGVLEVHTTTGIYDLILKVQAEDEAKFQELINKIKSISGVTSVITSVIYRADNTASPAS